MVAAAFTQGDFRRRTTAARGKERLQRKGGANGRDRLRDTGGGLRPGRAEAPRAAYPRRAHQALLERSPAPLYPWVRRAIVSHLHSSSGRPVRLAGVDAVSENRPLWGERGAVTAIYEGKQGWKFRIVLRCPTAPPQTPITKRTPVLPTKRRAHRTRVHQSLVDRLIFMSEDDVRTERTQQGRGGAGGGDRSSDSGSGDDSRAGQDLPSSAPTPPASGGGAASSGVGARGERKRGERKQLLVLIGDAGGT